MSDGKRTRSEYIERYAISYCKGDVAAAATHAMVQEVCKYMPDDMGNKTELQRVSVLEYVGNKVKG